MELTITKGEMINLFNTLSQMDVSGNPKFTYVIAKNRATLKPYVEVLQTENNVLRDDPRFKEYQRKSNALLREASTDEKGNPVTRQSADGQTLVRMIPPTKQAEFVRRREELDTEYQGILQALELQQADLTKSLREEITIPGIRTLSISDIPAEGINTQIMNLIFVFVEDDAGAVQPQQTTEKQHEKG